MRTITVFLATIVCGLSLTALADSAASSTPGSSAASNDSTASGQPAGMVSASAPGAEPGYPPPDRSFVFTDDPSIPSPGHAIVALGMGNVTKTGEERPIGAGGLIPTVDGEVGLLPRLSMYADVGLVFWSPGTPGISPVTLETGLRIQLTDPKNKDLILTVQPMYGLDDYGNNTLLLRASFAWNYNILRVVASATASHTFQTGADPMDLEATVGANVKIPYGFRLGVEGVVTDLEEIADAEDEGGSSAYIGPTVGWEWNRFQFVVGPAYGGGPNYYQGFLIRGAVSAKF